MSLENHGIPEEILDGIFAEEDTERGQREKKLGDRVEGSKESQLLMSFGNFEEWERKKGNCSCQETIQN